MLPENVDDQSLLKQIIKLESLFMVWSIPQGSMTDMGFEVLERERYRIKLRVKNYDNTYLRPLYEELLNDEMVEFAKLYIDHPVLSDPVLEVRVREGKPQNAVKRAARRLSNLFQKLLKQLESAGS